MAKGSYLATMYCSTWTLEKLQGLQKSGTRKSQVQCKSLQSKHTSTWKQNSFPLQFTPELSTVQNFIAS